MQYSWGDTGINSCGLHGGLGTLEWEQDDGIQILTEFFGQCANCDRFVPAFPWAGGQ